MPPTPSPSTDGRYWFCLNHHRVEVEDLCAYKDRMGPYDTEEDAARALEIARERTEAWDDDPRWQGRRRRRLFRLRRRGDD